MANTKTNGIQEDQPKLPQLFWGVIRHPYKTLGMLSQDQRKIWLIPALLAIIVLTASAGLSSMTATNQMMTPTDPTMMSKEGMVYQEGGGAPGGMGSATGALGAIAIGSAIIGKLFETALGWLIWAGALYLVSVFLGRSSTFPQMFRLTVWAWIPFIIRGLLQIAYILIAGKALGEAGLSGLVLDREAQALAMIPASPGQLALASILGNIDLFIIWNTLLLGLGLAAATKLTPKKALIAALCIWTLFALLSIIPGQIGGIFTSSNSGSGGGVGFIPSIFG